MRFGVHVSIAAGLTHALEYALSVGCECAQVFAKSPQQWRGPATDPVAAARFATFAAENDVPVFTHTAYLINLASPDETLWNRSVDALADELQRAALLGASGVVTHVGAARDGDRVAAAHRVGRGTARAVGLAAAAAGPCPRLLLENTAGAGTTFGATFEELAASIDASGLAPDVVGVCFDTCHGFAHGYPVDSQEGWAELVETISDTVGLDRLGLLHANDCKFARGSMRDRHEWIGDGFIGREGFWAMVCARGLEGLCAVTEMAGEAPEKDVVNIGRLREIRDECGKSA